MNMPKISVVIPLYNKASHILQTLESVYAQHYPVDEVVVIDDGSTDGGDRLIQAAGYPNLRLFKQKNQGVSAARNMGIVMAEHEHIAFLDADDQWLPMFIDEMVQLIRKYPDVGAYTSRYQCVEGPQKFVDAKINLNGINPEGMLMKNYFEIASTGDLPFMISSMIVSKSLIERVGDFPLGERIGEDQDFFARIAMAGPIAYCPNVNLLYHRDSENKATLMHVPKKECPYSARLKTVLQSHFSREEKEHVKRYCAAHLCDLAKKNIWLGRYAVAKQLLADSRCAYKPKHRVLLYCLASVKESINHTSILLQRIFSGAKAHTDQ